MKRYPITFVDDYLMYEEWGNNPNLNENDRNYWKRRLLDNKDKWELCVKWSGKYLSLQEAEENIEEFREILFDGKDIMIVNGHLD
jgi:hypothetical protein